MARDSPKFSGILNFRSNVRRLATSTLLGLAKAHSLKIDVSRPYLKNAFFGAHLSTELDAVAGWLPPDLIYGRYETQARCYLQQAPRSNSSVIYVASGDRNEVSKFSKDAESINMIVTTKLEILEGSDKFELSSLAWDQQVIVDFLVMHKASDFAGIGHSSFAWNIALKRRQFAEKKERLDRPQLLSDELNQIYGTVRQYPEYAACLWP